MICISDLTNIYHCFNQHSLYICASVLDNHVYFIFCFVFHLLLFPFSFWWTITASSHIREWPKKNRGWKIDFYEMHFTNNNTDFRAYGKIDLDMERRMEGKNLFKKDENVWLCFFPPSYSQCKCFWENGLQKFILQGVCLKRKLKKVMFIPWLWWLIILIILILDASIFLDLCTRWEF